MLFSSSVFLLFFLPCLIVLYYVIPRRFLAARNVLLLVFSLVFYGYGGLRYLWLLCACIAANYLAGLALGRLEGKKSRRAVLVAALVVDLGLLGVYKYAGFAAATAVALGIPLPVPQIVLPIGISFFTFQGVSYVIDVFRRNAPAQKNPLNVALYIAFFPQLVAGPIVRYTTIAEELSERGHSAEEFAAGLARFFFGFGKKMLLANTMGQIVDAAFADTYYSSFTAGLAWLGAVAYCFQIYFDFSGYSDMAIGLGRMFGFHFLENFDYPYTASSVTEFYRRWHISLCSWFRDYVYIPLGGSRCSKARNIFNLLFVWLLTGLWHGADWSFVLWGLYCGVLLILEKYPLKRALTHVPRAVRHVLTLLLVMLGRIFFRADTVQGAFTYYAVMLGKNGWGSAEAVYYLREFLPEFLLCVLAALPLKRWADGWLERRERLSAAWTARRVLPLVFAGVVFVLGYLKLVQGSFNPFIYFQF